MKKVASSLHKLRFGRQINDENLLAQRVSHPYDHLPAIDAARKNGKCKAIHAGVQVFSPGEFSLHSVAVNFNIAGQQNTDGRAVQLSIGLKREIHLARFAESDYKNGTRLCRILSTVGPAKEKGDCE